MNVNTNIAGSDRAAEIKANAKAQVDRLRQDKSLSPEGRRGLIAAIYRDTQAQLAGLRREVEQAPRRRRDEITKGLFGAHAPITGADAISYRDAHMRASQVSSQEDAQELLEMAKTTNDRVLADAVAQHAIKHRWIPTLESWSGGNQRIDDQLGELLGLNAELVDDSWSTAAVGNALAKDIVFNLERPVEVSDNDMTVSDVATGAA